MILPDHAIRDTVIREQYVIPAHPEYVNPASLDLRLGNTIRIPMWYWHVPILRYWAWHRGWEKWTEPLEFTTYVLKPGQFVLCHSLERTRIPNNCVALLFLKSSAARRGLEHSHAGYGDPGFDGQWTWELHNPSPWPIPLRAGEPLVQLMYARLMSTPDATYEVTGRYQAQVGPQPER